MFLIILVYVLIGMIICKKYGLIETADEDSIADTFIDGLFVAFWPFIIAIHFLIAE